MKKLTIPFAKLLLKTSSQTILEVLNRGNNSTVDSSSNALINAIENDNLISINYGINQNEIDSADIEKIEYKISNNQNQEGADTSANTEDNCETRFCKEIIIYPSAQDNQDGDAPQETAEVMIDMPGGGMERIFNEGYEDFENTTPSAIISNVVVTLKDPNQEPILLEGVFNV